MEGSDSVKRDALSSVLKDTYFETLSNSLKKPAHQKVLFKYISDYRNRNIEVLSSSLIVKLLPFNHSGEDANVVFTACGLDREEVEKTIIQVLKILALDQAGKNITAFNVVMVMAMSYFSEDKNKLTMLYMYYAYSFYFSIFTRQFKKFAPDANTMQYTLDNMNNKFTLKKEGSLDGVLNASMSVAVKCYPEKFKNLSDFDIVQIINAFKTRVGHMMKNVFNAYNKNYIAGNRVFTTVERNAEGELILDRDTNLGVIAKLASQYTTKFFSNGANYSIVKLCSSMCNVSENELRSAISLILKDEMVADVKRFYECLFYLFFETFPNSTEGDVRTMKFFAAADAIYKKGNSNDKNIKTIKDISHKWLSVGSNTYQTTQNAGTINNFRKAIYFYFVNVVSSS